MPGRTPLYEQVLFDHAQFLDAEAYNEFNEFNEDIKRGRIDVMSGVN